MDRHGAPLLGQCDSSIKPWRAWLNIQCCLSDVCMMEIYNSKALVLPKMEGSIQTVSLKGTLSEAIFTQNPLCLLAEGSYRRSSSFPSPRPYQLVLKGTEFWSVPKSQLNTVSAHSIMKNVCAMTKSRPFHLTIILMGTNAFGGWHWIGDCDRTISKSCRSAF